MAIKIQGNTSIFDDETFKMAAGTTAERPVSPVQGMFRFNTDFDTYEIYDGAGWVRVISTDVVLATPTITVTGSPSSVPEDPTISTSAFTVITGTSTHVATDWEVRHSSNNELVFSSYGDTTNLVSIDVPTGILAETTSYAFRARHIGSNFGESVFGTTTATTAAAVVLTLGQSYCGGFYIGTIWSASTCYYLIVAPNATGCAFCQWKTTRTATTGTGSLVDGYSNTYGPMNNATHPAGNWTATRTIGGFSDWYLPAKDELNQLYINDGGSTNTNLPAGEGFAGALVYWSSTENSATLAWYQSFANGSVFNGIKTNSRWGRAVRREPI